MKKGLRDIKTLSSISRKKNNNCKRQIKVNKFNKITNIQEKSFKTWVFTRQPKFLRFQKSLHVKRVDEPHIDIFDESTNKNGKKNIITIIAQIPGVRKQDIKFEIRGDILAFEVDISNKRSYITYYKEVILPFEVKPLYTKMLLRHGILQIDFEKK